MVDKRRRKSLIIFKSRTNDVPSGNIPAVPTDIDNLNKAADFDKSGVPRPRLLQKSHRSSLLGSLRSLTSLEDEDKLTKTESKTSSILDDEDVNIKDLCEETVLHYGEVQIAANMFRKRTVYLVLTEMYLVRFKNQAKATEYFPTLPAPLKRSSTIRGSSTSQGSYPDLQHALHAETTSGIRLDQVVAAYKLDDGRPFFTIEVAYIDEPVNRASSLQMQLNDPKEAELWLLAIRSAVGNARAKDGLIIPPQSLGYITEFVDRQLDYDPAHFQAFKVVQRAAHRSVGRTPSEDLSKVHSLVCYLAVGINKVHLIPLDRTSTRSSSSSLPELDGSLSFGIVTLSSITVPRGEDSIQLTFKEPTRNPFTLLIASMEVKSMTLWLRSALEYLRPEWIRQHTIMHMPAELEDAVGPVEWPQEDNNSFDRTLIAYCAAFMIDTSNICYTVESDCEDSPCFRLIPNPQRQYSALELLAVFRALRYNEAFASISFSHVDLTALRLFYDDSAEADPDNFSTRSGTSVNIEGHHDLPVLLQEIRAVALKSKKLRRFDFTYSLPQLSSSGTELRSCGVPEALVPLCKRSLTNVDWIILNGIPLAESDIDYLVDAASERRCHLRAIELGDCGLSVHDANVLLSTLSTQENTLEVINLSGAQGRFSTELFQQQISCFANIRKLNLTRVQKSAGSEPLIAPETLLNWRLEELYLSQTTINEQAVDSISAYLASPKSNGLRELHLNQCGISGKDAAVFFRSMAHSDTRRRDIHVSISENRLKVGCSLLFKAIEQDCGPTKLTMRMIDFEKEYQFRELIQALTHNRTLRKLDLSGASLPSDAGEETCEALKRMFVENTTMEELDISGEHAHLETARFGIGLKSALEGLMKNTTLKVLRIEHQGLGLQGVDTLAELLQGNQSLLEIHCDNNDINLQDYTVLVNSLWHNQVLLYFPDLDSDREKWLERKRRELSSQAQNESTDLPARAGTIRRTFTGGIAHRAQRLALKHSDTMPAPARHNDHDVSEALSRLNEKWNAQIARMRKYLTRNHYLANGMPWEEDREDDGRPPTAGSLAAAIMRVHIDDSAGHSRTQAGSVDNMAPETRGVANFTLPDD